jgi:putative heme iron utilization protein
LAGDSFEHPVEVSQRLETNLKGDLADAQIGIEQQVFGFLDAHAREVIREIDARDFFEHFAKIKCAGIDRFGD